MVDAIDLRDIPPMSGLVRDDEGEWYCPKCRHYSGDDWRQCDGSCPVSRSPHFGKTPAPVEPEPETDDIPY